MRFTTHEFAKALREPLFHIKQQMRNGSVAGIDVRKYGIRDESGRLVGIEIPDAAAKRLGIDAPAVERDLPEPTAKSPARASPKRAPQSGAQVSDQVQEEDEPPVQFFPAEPDPQPTDADVTAVAERDSSTAVTMYERENPAERSRKAKGWMLLGGIVVAGMLLPTIVNRSKH